LMPEFALRGGATLVILNQGATELDHAAKLRIDAGAGEVMTRMLDLVRKKLGGAG
jgi:NAD-dependent SIR2 family protein deacetylase